MIVGRPAYVYVTWDMFLDLVIVNLSHDPGHLYDSEHFCIELAYLIYTHIILNASSDENLLEKTRSLKYLMIYYNKFYKRSNSINLFIYLFLFCNRNPSCTGDQFDWTAGCVEWI